LFRSLPAVDGVEDDLVADVVEHLREDPRRGPGQDRAGGRGRELLGRRRVGVQDVEVAACAEREGAGDRRDPGGATGRPTGRFDQRRHQNPTVTFRKMPRLGGYGAMSMLERIGVEPKFETSGSSPEYLVHMSRLVPVRPTRRLRTPRPMAALTAGGTSHITASSRSFTNVASSTYTAWTPSRRAWARFSKAGVPESSVVSCVP